MPSEGIGPSTDGIDRLDWGELIEELARLEHEQWWEWSNSLAKNEDLSEERTDRWEDYWVPYDELDEETKEHDRKWAKKAVERVYDHLQERLELDEMDEEERDTVLVSIEDSWVDEHDYVHLEVLAPRKHYEDKGIPVESAILEVLQPVDYKKASSSSPEGGR